MWMTHFFLTFNAMWLACSSSLQMTHPFINPFSYHLYGSTWIAKCIKSPLSLTLLLRPDASLAHFGTAAIKRWQETWMVLQSTKARMSVCWQRHYSVGWSIVFVSCSFVCLFFSLKCVNVSTPQCLITVRDVWNLSGFMTAWRSKGVSVMFDHFVLQLTVKKWVTWAFPSQFTYFLCNVTRKCQNTTFKTPSGKNSQSLNKEMMLQQSRETGTETSSHFKFLVWCK